MVLNFTIAVILLELAAFRWVRWIGRRRQWRTISPGKRHLQTLRATDEARSAFEVTTHHGADLGVPQHDLETALDMAMTSERSLQAREESTFLLTFFIPILIPGIPFAIVNPPLPSAPESALVVSVGGFVAFATIMLTTVTIARKFQAWKKANGDHGSLTAAVELVNYLGKGESREINSLAVEDQMRGICQRLCEFAATSPHFSSPDRRREIESHVLAVQKRLFDHAGAFFKDGADHTGATIADLATLIGRIVHGRWLRLLDIEDGEAADVTTPAAADSHDAWLVVGSSAFAAVALASAVSLGVPVSAAVPGAVVLLLGPAAVWGKNLGITPRGLFESTKAALAGPAEAAGQQEPPPASAGEGAP
ncbi:hypothetical protein [Streptomyces sp. NPDC005385]|uniref:hypothetical protein n=1 Tax=unclassified Streptomyces TaxID=2593676 RepID=UPI0033B5D5E7